MTAPSPAAIRSKVEPMDIPPVKAARRLHLTLEQFRQKLPELRDRGFPPPDPTTGHYYLPSIDQWMALRFDLTTRKGRQDDPDTINARIARL